MLTKAESSDSNAAFGRLRVSTAIGHFVDRVWVTEGMKPGIVACSHHLGRWRRDQDPKANRWATNLVDITNDDNGVWMMRVKEGTKPYESDDPDAARIFWGDGGVAQNLTFCVQPNPISGMQCWHQVVTVETAKAEDHMAMSELIPNWLARSTGSGWPWHDPRQEIYAARFGLSVRSNRRKRCIILTARFRSKAAWARGS